MTHRGRVTQNVTLRGIAQHSAMPRPVGHRGRPRAIGRAVGPQVAVSGGDGSGYGRWVVVAESFGALLRRHRIAAVLTQEALAERAGISATGVAALEAGRRSAPRSSTIALLLGAFDLTDEERAALVTAAGSTGRDPSIRPPTDGGASQPAASPARRVTGNFPGLVGRFDFVDRPREVGRLRAAWSNRVRVVLVHGEAGAGKTRLVSEFVASVAADPMILWGRCTIDRLGAYEPFVEPVRCVVRQSSTNAPIDGELARLVPALPDGCSWAASPVRADPGVERRLLFEAVEALLSTLGPTLLVLDDFHWADAASLSLLAYLGASALLGDVVIVATVRSNDLSAVQAGALAELRRTVRVERIDLDGLQGDALTSLVERVAGEPVSASFAATIAQATDGNPLFVEELTEHLLAQANSGGPKATVPRSLLETLTGRVDSLSLDAQALLRAGAVLGRQFEVDLAGQLARLDGDRLLAACDDALLSTLVDEVSAVRFSFSHALVQSAVYETTSARRRLAWHRGAARHLELRIGDATAPDATIFDIARHWTFVAASDASAESAAARWAMRSGDAAAAAADIDEAIQRYGQAAELWSQGTREHADTLIRLGRMLSALGRTDEADERFRAARHLADGLGDRALYARAAIGLAATVRYGRSDPERIDALDRSLRDLAPEETALRTTAAAMLKRQLGFDLSEGAYDRRQDAARVVFEAVSASCLEPELLLSLGAARDSIVVDDPVILEGLSRQIVAAASSPRDLAVLANAWYARAWAALELSDRAGWDESVAAFNVVSGELRLPYELALAATMATTTALIEGRYPEAEVFSQQALELATVGGDPNARAVHLTGAVLRGVDLGHAEQMVGVMEAMHDELAEVPTFMAGLTMTAALAGDLNLAKRLFGTQAAHGFHRVRRDLEWLPVIGFYAHACSVVGDTTHAAQLYELLAASPASGIRVGPLAGWWGPTDFHLGALCRVLGRNGEASARLHSAIAVCEQMSAHPWLARCQTELARIEQ
jgi:transcriptional regulator with XRE-family HTH domain/tetratricopeptide (TPR) repeat protein